VRSYDNPGLQYDLFGASVAAVGPNVIVGAPNGVSFYTGVAYLFDGATGGLLQTFNNPTPDGDDGFGQVVGALDGDALVGDPYDSTDLPSAGQVHRFDAATGALVRTFHGPGGLDGTFGYGSLVDLDGDLLAGAPGDQTVADSGGAAYLLDGATGALRARFLPSPVTAGDIAGYTVATVGTYVVVAAPYADTPAEDEGRVFLFEPCGSGIVEGDEECDDGNTVDGDGCSSLCFVEPCTAIPPTGCHEPGASGRARLVLKDGGSDTLRWKWRGDTTLPELGDPTSTSHHELCIWDSSGAPQPRFARAVAGGETCGRKPCWREMPEQGFTFKDAKPTDGGLSGVLLRAGTGSARVAVKGKGADLGVPVPPLTPPVTVQLHNVETDACWTAQYTSPMQNLPGRFSARSD
jgi:cysteine-rich repeat protein